MRNQDEMLLYELYEIFQVLRAPARITHQLSARMSGQPYKRQTLLTREILEWAEGKNPELHRQENLAQRLLRKLGVN